MRGRVYCLPYGESLGLYNGLLRYLWAEKSIFAGLMPRRASDDLNARIKADRGIFSSDRLQWRIVSDIMVRLEIKRRGLLQAACLVHQPKTFKIFAELPGCAIIINHDSKLIRNTAQRTTLPPMDGTSVAVRTVRGKEISDAP